MHVHNSAPRPTTRKKTVLNPLSHVQMVIPARTRISIIRASYSWHSWFTDCDLKDNDVISRTMMLYREQWCCVENNDVIPRTGSCICQKIAFFARSHLEGSAKRRQTGLGASFFPYGISKQYEKERLTCIARILYGKNAPLSSRCQSPLPKTPLQWSAESKILKVEKLWTCQSDDAIGLRSHETDGAK